MILENLKRKKIILASQSPRRQELLKGVGVDYQVFVKEDIDESFDREMPFQQVAEYLAIKKARAYADLITEETILITADTVVCTDSEILNKPADFDEARYMLRQLSGRKHSVITGVCIKSIDKEKAFSSKSIVYFADLSQSEIDYYITHYKPFDKAGAYGIQEWIGYIGIEKIEGSFYNVMGLPIQMVYNELKEF